VRLWLRRFDAAGLDRLQVVSRAGRPATYTPAEVGEVLAATLTNPRGVDLPFANAEKGFPITHSRIDELLIAEGLRWRRQETWFGERATWTAPHITTDQCELTRLLRHYTRPR
jgi:transposase